MVKKAGKSVASKGMKAARKAYGGKTARGIATLSGIRGVVKTTREMKKSARK